jgi:hypothetical protein
MEKIAERGFIVRDEFNGKTEILINQTHLKGVFVGVRSRIKLSKIFMPENFDPNICLIGTLNYFLPEFTKKLMVLLRRKTDKVSLGIIEAITPETIIRVMKDKISDFNRMARIQISTFITNPQTFEQIKVNIYIIVSGIAPSRYIFIGPNEIKQTSIKIFLNH